MSASPAKRTSQSLDPGVEDERVALAKRVKRERVEGQQPSQREVRERSAYYDQGNDDSDSDHRDASDDEDDDCEDMEANIEALQKQRQRERSRNPNALATAGVVKEISLVNFMCHENLTVSMAEKMNFVVGHNGSGKSAILTGLAVALGAKATITGRGAGLKSLIMSGKDKAKIIVTMRNVGEDAFMPDQFGDEVVIERTLDKSGASGFKFRNGKGGPIVSDKRDVLTKMCAQWQINIDSPLCMLTQDNAKTFLARTDPKVMYSFFLRGTNLASIMEQYQETNVLREKLSRDLANADEALPEQQAKVKKLRNQIQLAEKARTLRSKQEDLKAQLAWAFVHDKEQELEQVNQFLQDLTAKEEKIQGNLTQVAADQEKAEADLAGVKEDITQFVDGHNQTMHEINARKRRKQEAQAALAATQSSINQCRGEIDAREEEIREMEAKLAAARREEEGEVNPEQAKLQEQLAKAEANLSGLQRRLPQSEREVTNAKATYEEADKEQSQADAACAEVERKLSDLKRSKEQLEARRTDRLAPYGRNVRSVMQAIGSAQWKHSKPIGPLGLHVKLKDNAYRNCISNMLGGTLCAFAVRDRADQHQLLRIFDQCARDYQFSASPYYRGSSNMPAVIQHSGDVFDYSNGDLHRMGFGDTVLSKIEVDHDEVLRILINQHQIERYLVAKTDDEALDIINRTVSDQQPRVNVVTAREFQHSGQFRNNLRTSGPQNRWRGPEMFVTDVESEIQALRPQIAECEQELRQLRTVQNDRRKALSQARENLVKAEGDLKRNQQGIPHMRRSVESIQDKLRAFRPIDGNATEISLEEVRGEKTKLQEELNALEGTFEIRSQDLAVAVAEFEAGEEQIRTFHEELDRKREAAFGLQQQLASLKNHEGHWHKSLERTRTEMQRTQESIEDVERTLKDWTNSATGFMPRPEVFGDANDLETQRKAVDRQIEEAKRITNIDLDQVVQQHYEESERLDRTVQLINKFREIEAILKEGFYNRTAQWQVMRRHFAVQIHTQFIHNIRMRGFDGKLKFDHQDFEELHVEVATGNDAPTQRERVYKGPASLSGGERSFVTVSLLLAMWDSAPSNLRCLDEWDVFLDSANRRIAAGLLVEGSKNSTSKQFVLISPLDMNGVNTNGPGNKVVRLADPVRGNQRRIDEFRS